MKDLIIQNLITCGCAMIIFVVSYIANICFSLYLNISLLSEKWDCKKFLNSLVKALVFIVGMSLLVVGLTTLPLFAGKVGWAIPEEFTDLFNALVIIGVVLYTSIKYLKKAFDKFKQILDFTPEDEVILEESSKNNTEGQFYTTKDVLRLLNITEKEDPNEPAPNPRQELPEETNQDEKKEEEPKNGEDISMEEFIALVNESMK